MNYKTPMQNQNKGYESRDLKDMPIISRATVGSSISKHMTTPTHMMGSLKGKGSAMMMKGAMKGDQSKSRLDYESPAKMGAKKGDQSKSRLDYEGSPAKNLGMKYDIKEASNQSLSKKARKRYAENAQAASESGYKG